MGAVVVAVGICDDGQTAEVILIAKHRPSNHSVARVPDSEPVTKQVLRRPRHFELDKNLPIPRRDGLRKGGKVF